jgi:hypothetical protein
VIIRSILDWLRCILAICDLLKHKMFCARVALFGHFKEDQTPIRKKNKQLTRNNYHADDDKTCSEVMS